VSSVKLSEKQDEIRIRVLKAWNLMINYLQKNRRCVIMNEYGCSRAQSYRYVSDAMSVWQSCGQSKEAEKYL
jgi:hypothetical protein